MEISELLKPENELEKRIIGDAEFAEGAMFGEPRPGHPEGKVVYHIKAVLENIDSYSMPDNRTDLRIVGLVHDTFKYKVDRNKPKSGENHHATIARRFAERFVAIPRVLETIELHDEAYNSWQKGERKANWEKAEERAIKLIQTLEDIDFYLVFYKCDNQTGEKSSENYNWFKDLAEKHKQKS